MAARLPTASNVHEKVLGCIFDPRLLRERHEQFDMVRAYYDIELDRSKMARRFSRTCTIPNSTSGSYDDLIQNIQALQAQTTETKTYIRIGISTARHGTDEASITRAMELAVRIWLMLNVRPREERLLSRAPLLCWDQDQSLAQLVVTSFPRSRSMVEIREGFMHPSFTAAFMIEVCELHLEWTDSFADHLRLDRRTRTLQIFGYKSFLSGHLELYSNTAQGKLESPFPAKLLTETLWTLNVLFPSWDVATSHLLKKHNQNFQSYGPFDVPPALNLIEFEYWRDRLHEVYDVVFLSPPASWRQLWKDRRQPQQFWTFWIALLILALTVLSTIATLIQAWASVAALQRG